MHGPLVSLRYILNQQIKAYRVAVVVSRKVSKSAVVRNRIRRRIYEAVREVETDIGEPFDLVFLVHDEELAKLRSPQLRSAVHSVLGRAGVLRSSQGSANNKNHDILVPKETDI
jgi:ribonuclease P protein component